MNPECYIRRIDFPNRSVEAAAFVNDDGTFDIYINTLYPLSVQEAALHHELEHIRLNHFYSDKPIRQKEREADGLCPVPADSGTAPLVL
jgi:predicted metal-dependent peptidase